MTHRPPFFIVGFQRSGTTLLRVMLDAHPDIAIPLDTVGLWDRFEQRLDRYDRLGTEPGRRQIVRDLLIEERIRLWKADLSEDSILRLWNDHSYPGLIDAFYTAYANRQAKHGWGDKDPGNMQRIDQLNRWFPSSQFIHIIRDGRDACLSQLEQDFGFDNLLDCACAWREEVQWVRRIGGILGPRRYYELKYEDLVTNPAEELKKVCRFLAIPYTESMLKYHESVEKAVPLEKRHIWALINQPPMKSNIARWKRKLSHARRVCFEKRAGGMLRDMGYEVLPKASGAYFEELRNLGASGWKSLRRRLRGK